LNYEFNHCSRLPPKLVDLSYNAITADTDTGFQTTQPAAFSKIATPNPSLEPAVRTELEYTLRIVKRIFRKALPWIRGHNEKALCDDVVRSLVRLALRQYTQANSVCRACASIPTDMIESTDDLTC
jgi:hypothetical protein